ncbi:hypothetical protein Q8A67_008718 [Cirrhinus molitorella]|uniref:Uncharacterized protein n=1 Tax=Cirrhinus molitorella TaxID=172907 RepID=A0AA88TNX3_9TELE|nr:hypothetical protein Q8A67_008718 [Cirrhinus molitorella]
MEVPYDFNFSDGAEDIPGPKRLRKYPELQKPTDGQEEHLALMPPIVPSIISKKLEKSPHSLSRMTELITQASGADVKPIDSPGLKVMKKRQRKIYEKQDLGAEDILQQYKLSVKRNLASVQVSQILQQSPEKVLFIFDGSDELKLTQNIFDMSAHINPLQKSPPEVILCALLRGHILPKSFLLVTTRTEDTVNKLLKGQPCFTEIMGFYENDVQKYFQKCCKHIRNLKLSVTPDNLKMLRPELYRCKELWLMMDRISDDDVCLIKAAGEGKILHKLIIKLLENSGSVFCPEIVSVRDKEITLSVCSPVVTETSLKTEFTLTCPNSLFYTIKWLKLQNKRAMHSYNYFGLEEEEVHLLRFLKCVPDLKKVCLQVSNLTDKLATQILSLIQACPSLIEFSVNIRKKILVQIQSLMEKLELTGWTLAVWRKSLFIQPDVTRFTKEELTMTKREETESKIGESLDCVPCSSIKGQLSAKQSSSEDAEVFTPELIQRCDEDKHKNTYRFLCPHAGQFRCSLTNLVFTMESEGKMLYNIVSWDSCLLDGLGQMKPAGPLYNIDCAAGSVSQLHLPHCEILSEKNKDGLAVAHCTGGNIEMIQPLNVTKTHVIIDIKDLSIFGLIKKIFSGSLTAAQVLLFLRPVTVEQKQKILNVHLLPGNVPVSEVQRWHQDKTYIETSSQCHLFPGREYSLCCQPEHCEVQPMSEMFECNHFGPNYHPMFEVFLDVSIEEVRLGVLDKTKDGKEVWNRRRILLTAPSQVVEPPAQRRFTESEFVNKHGKQLIQRVSSVMAFADCLKSKNMISSEMYNKVHAAEPRQEKMRLLLDVLDSGGASVKAEFYRLLKETEPHLVDDLESGPSGPD